MSLNALLITFAVLLSGCVWRWPDLPSTEYTGIVVNTALNRPEPNAEVSATRPSARGLALMIAPEELGKTTTTSDGCFRLRTTTGYATEFHARSFDDRLYGHIDVNSPCTSVVLPISPGLSSIVGREADPESAVAKVAETAVKSIMLHISSHPHERRQSLSGYARSAVITQEQLAVFKANPKIFFGSAPSIGSLRYIWGHQKFAFKDANTPVRFTQADQAGSFW